MALDPLRALPRQPVDRPLRVAFFGTPALALPTLEGLLARPELCEVVAVVAQPDKESGRGRKLRPPPVARRATELGLPLYQPRRVKTGEFPEALEALDLDLAVVIAYGRILTTRILETPRYGCINVHASLLPAWRGAGPIQWSILAGDRETGVTTMWMEEGLDTGPILLCRSLEIGGQETAGTLGGQLSELGSTLLVETVEALVEGKLVARDQPDTGASYARLLTREDAALDWSEPAVVLERRIRGLSPWPGTRCAFRGEQLKVHAAEALPENSDSEAGQIVSVSEAGLVVACGEGMLRLTRVQPPGRKAQDAGDFARGYRPEPGESLVIAGEDSS
ncbi:MAG: methionyl-tRNA formyltransferase [Myxococcota bacterium]|nr:methionyl-tRNA formyltransferase [Myxococcota bacterium]